MSYPKKLQLLHVVESKRSSLASAGNPRPSMPVSVFAEDLTLILRSGRMRIARSKIRILN